MTITQLRAALDAHPFQHPLTDSNVESVSIDGSDIIFETDVSFIRNELGEAEVKSLESEANDHAEKLNAAETERDKLQAELDSIKETLADMRDPESGVTLLTMLSRTAEAEKRAAEAWEVAAHNRKCAEADRAELTALRRRKGIEPQLFANGRSLIELVQEIARDKALASHPIGPKAKEICHRISESAWRLAIR